MRIRGVELIRTLRGRDLRQSKSHFPWQRAHYTPGMYDGDNRESKAQNEPPHMHGVDVVVCCRSHPSSLSLDASGYHYDDNHGSLPLIAINQNPPRVPQRRTIFGFTFDMRFSGGDLESSDDGFDLCEIGRPLMATSRITHETPDYWLYQKPLLSQSVPPTATSKRHPDPGQAE